jgi:hypothetical protein
MTTDLTPEQVDDLLSLGDQFLADWSLEPRGEHIDNPLCRTPGAMGRYAPGLRLVTGHARRVEGRHRNRPGRYRHLGAC